MSLTDSLKAQISEYEEIAPYRKDVNKFLEKVIKPDDGSKLDQEEIHRSWVRHIQFCRKNSLYSIVFAPFGHGKTTRLITGFALKEIGDNPNVRIQLLSSVDEVAQKRVKTIRKYIKEDPDYHKIYPQIRMDKNDSDQVRQFVVERSSKAIDPTLGAGGVLTTGIGGRFNMILGDDVVEYKNTIEVPANRIKVLETLQNTWFSRLEPGGFISMICTAWHEEDASHVLMRRKAFCTLIQRVSEDFTHIVCEVVNSPDPSYQNFTVPLSKRYQTEALLKKVSDLTLRVFNRGFRQFAYSDDEKVFPSFVNCIDYNVSINQIKSKNLITTIGVDLSSKTRPGTVLTVLGIDEQGFKSPIEIIYGKFTSPETVKQLAALDHVYNPVVIKVENNAYQNAIIEWIGEDKEKYPFWSKVQPFTTGAQKSDPEKGLPALEVEFSNKGWIIPGMEFKDHEPNCKCGWCLFFKEFRDYGISPTTDCVMASWFAWSGIRQVWHSGKQVIGAFGQSESSGLVRESGNRDAFGDVQSSRRVDFDFF